MVHVNLVTHFRELNQMTPEHVCRILAQPDKNTETWEIVSIVLIMKGVKTITLNVVQIHVTIDKFY